ncbi:MAG: ribosome-binding factor A [Victivallaceae bacterium]
MGNVDRLTRVNELLKREIADLLERNPYPGAGSMLISVTMVKSSVDLRNATVHISVFGGRPSEGPEVIRHLQRLRPELQRKIAADLAFKHTPVLDFRLDERLSKADKVLEMLNQAKDEEKSDA